MACYYRMQYVKKKRIPQMIFSEKVFLGSNFGISEFEQAERKNIYEFK